MSRTTRHVESMQLSPSGSARHLVFMLYAHSLKPLCFYLLCSTVPASVSCQHRLARRRSHCSHWRSH